MAPMSRRTLLRSVAGSAVLIPFLPAELSGYVAVARRQGADPLTERRAQLGATPIVPTRLSDTLTLLAGPGGNVLVLAGPEGKLVVDSFVQPAWPALQRALDGMGPAPIRTLIDTHWHFDHTDNNENFRRAGAAVIAHANTAKRMAESHDLLGMRLLPSPAAALPTATFTDTHRIEMNGENVEAGRIPPAHTDTDVYIRFARANVLHLGDVFFNGMYPFIDAGTGGSIDGQIAGANLALSLADNATRIIPGHGPVADKAALTRYRDVLVTVRERVRTLKMSGRTLAQVVAGRPTADLDEVWGKGFMAPADFIGIVYVTLP
jgi:cyclase